MEGVLDMPRPNCQDPESVELILIEKVVQLQSENRLDYSKDFQNIESLDFLNSLDFNEIEAILNSLED